MPDGSEGKKCKCPGCQTTLSIPCIEIETIESKLEVPCPGCDFVLVCDPALKGTRGLCPNCKLIFTIAPLGATMDGELEPNPPLTFAFQCPHCKQLFEGKSGMEGRNGKCIHCNEVFEIKKHVDPKSFRPATRSDANKNPKAKPNVAPKRKEAKHLKPSQPAVFDAPSTPKKAASSAAVPSQADANRYDWLSAIPDPITNVNPHNASHNPYATTAPSLSSGSYRSGPVSGDANSIRKFHLPHESAIKGFALLYAIASGFYILCAVAAVIATVYVLATGLNGAAAVAALIYAIGYFVVGLLIGFVASGLYKLNDVGRIGGAIFAVLSLCAIPLGTILGAYLLYLLFSEKGNVIFSSTYRSVVKQTRDIRPYTPVFVWVVFALIALSILILAFALLAAVKGPR